MSGIGLLAGFAVAAAVSAGVTAVAIPLLRRGKVLDVPNERSSHTVVTPRGGGIGVVAGLGCGVATALALGASVPGWWFWLGVAVLSATGFADDTRKGGLPPAPRLVVQLLVAGLVVWQRGGLERLPLPAPADVALGWLGAVLAVVWIVAVTNIYNFLDGIDGYAGLQGLLAGLGFAVVGSDALAAVALGAAGACAGFLAHNWHPARIFLGDVGSGALGFVFAALPFVTDPIERPEMVFAAGLFLWFFLADGAYTILRRVVRRERFWAAHRSHLYQRLTQTGLGHDEVAGRVGAGMAVIGAGGAAAGYVGGGGWVALTAAIFGWAMMLLWTRRREGAG